MSASGSVLTALSGAGSALPEFAHQALRALNYAGFGSDLGEALTAWQSAEAGAARGEQPGDAWHAAWAGTAARVSAHAAAAEAGGDAVSAANALLRAAEYHRQSEFFLRGVDNAEDPRRQAAMRETASCFRRYLDLRGIKWKPFDTGLAKGYLVEQPASLPSRPARSPVIIIPTGADALCEEM
jgi:hypothetical protein